MGKKKTWEKGKKEGRKAKISGDYIMKERQKQIEGWEKSEKKRNMDKEKRLRKETKIGEGIDEYSWIDTKRRKLWPKQNVGTWTHE
jgi:hypothetical protein